MTATMHNVNHPLLAHTDAIRQLLHKRLTKKEALGQYFSNSSVSDLMASMMDYGQKNIRILDPGAGVGSLFTACAEHICGKKRLPDSIEIVAYEIDELLFGSIDDSLMQIKDVCDSLSIRFSGTLVRKDFVQDYARTSDVLAGGFTHVIMNPPYKKINVSSRTYGLLCDVGLQTTNMYSAFIAISHNVLNPGGQITFISPRSFCNGTYFYPFRRDFLRSMSLQRIHLFTSRTSSFSDDGVLQENVIICAKKKGLNRNVTISSGSNPREITLQRIAKKSDVVFEDDPKKFIHIATDAQKADISKRIRNLPCTLENLGISVSTGRVVDFRIKDELRFADENGAVPLVRPFNIRDGVTRFPIDNRKHCNFIMANENSKKLLICNGNYVLVKRFTTIEQNRRVIASVWTRKEHDSDLVGFENRINYFHNNGRGLEYTLAKGLWAFLNSEAVDSYFRQFNGSTQVNAADLRYLKYPSRKQLEAIGNLITSEMNRDEMDKRVYGLLFRQAVSEQ